MTVTITSVNAEMQNKRHEQLMR